MARAANTQSAVAQSATLNLLLIQNLEAENLWLKGVKGVQMNEVEQDQYEGLLATFLTFYENLYWQHHRGLLDDDIYTAWDNDLKNFVSETHLERYWNKRKNSYHEDFRNHVDDLIRQNQSATTP